MWNAASKSHKRDLESEGFSLLFNQLLKLLHPTTALQAQIQSKTELKSTVCLVRATSTKQEHMGEFREKH